MSNFSCDEMVRSINLMELIEIESMDCLYNFRENILNGRENYEWDIISIFKIYNNYIENPPPGIPTCECPYCSGSRLFSPQHYTQQLTMIKRYVYIMWFMKAITDKDIIERVRRFINHQRGGKEIRKRIDEFYKYIYDNRIELPERCQNIWKNKEYYYQQLFGISYMISSIGVPDEHYIYRDLVCFSDSIIGHPKASHGWYQDSLDDMNEFDGLNQSSSISSTSSVAGLN